MTKKPLAASERAKADQPGLVDAELMHAVDHHDAGREPDSARQVEARGNWLTAEVEGRIVGIDGMDFVVGDPAGGARIGNAMSREAARR